MNKNSYPNQNSEIRPSPSNIDKWLSAAKELSIKEKSGINRVSAIRQVTSSWNVKETFRFLNWLKFYEEGAHMKYKQAQVWYENGAPGYFLQVKKDTNNTEEFKAKQEQEKYEQDSKKALIEAQRKKIIARLDSAEKLLRSQEASLFAGNELEAIMEAIFALKKKIQLVNKFSLATKLYEDMIVREANILNKIGFTKAANMLSSLAQEPPPPASPGNPTEPQGATGGLPSMGPGMPQNPPESAPPGDPAVALDAMQKAPQAQETGKPLPPQANQPKPVPKGISEFLEKLETSNLSDTADMNDSEDEEEGDDKSNADVELSTIAFLDDSNFDNVFIDDEEDDLIVVAQAQPVSVDDVQINELDNPEATKEVVKEVKKPLAPVKPEAIKSNVKTEGEESEEEAQQDNSAFDNQMDAMLENVTVEDVIAKLENISIIFKKREVARELAFVDMMLNKLNLSTYFVELYEILNKNYEASNYSETRVDDLLSKLKGATESSKTISMSTIEKETTDPKVKAIQTQLKSQEDSEKARKDMRKNKDLKKLEEEQSEEKETPEVDIVEDIQEETPTTTPPTVVPKV